jgi:2-oxoglutarate dehydrogenase E1 component
MDRDFGINQAFVEELYLRYRENKHAVDESWRKYFDRITADGSEPFPAPGGNGNGHAQPAVAEAPRLAPTLAPTLAPSIPPAAPSQAEVILAAAAIQGRVYSLINAYRSRGHLFANLDPLGLTPTPWPELTIETFGFSEADLDTAFPTGDLAGPEILTLREIVARCEETYCRTIGVEFMHLESREERLWLQERMESTCNRLTLSPAEQLRILTKLTDAEIFEQFLHTNFIGAKRFSCEGTESMIPLMDLLIEEAGRHGVEEMVIGMAHRGRLNVLANILGKPVRDIFAAFEDKNPEKNLGRGDVKYHLGYSNDRETVSGQKVHLSLAFNPSHLEFVGAVVEGRVRAKQDRRGDRDRKRVIPLVLHGDAAFMGQGIVAETLNMSGLEGYYTGGTIHVVINNQIGFTTSPNDSRSTRYATDITWMLKIPVFHVNGEDPEAVAQVTRLAVDYRQKFGKDVCIDLYGYRKYGHNEGDEPRFTQPVMYAAIDRKPTVRQVFIKRLVEMGSLTEAQAEEIARARKQHLENELAETRKTAHALTISAFAGLWNRYRGGTDVEVPDVDTTVPAEKLIGLLEEMVKLPATFKANPKVVKAWEDRVKHARAGTRSLDWATGEALAFASLLAEGVRVRLSGQDARRGTFSHRHAVLIDAVTAERWSPFSKVAQGKGHFEVWDSPLSEAAVMGFDYGYSLDYPDGLVLWEAQFGDFANGAQVIIDQFLSAAEDKWNRLSGLVLLLPHGFEGQGPEHSSARLERFLQLCAEDNMFVCNMTTSAQLFHVLRRQIHRPLRKPLVIMSPKGLLRQSFSSIDEFARGGFQRMIPDTGVVATPEGNLPIDPAKVDRVLLCSGKLYYELEAARSARKATHVAIVRIEQLYPLSKADLDRVLAPYEPGTQLVWVQEEPWNMGAWYYLNARMPEMLAGRHPLVCVARAESASPATGSPASHKIEQAMVIDEAFATRG